MFRITNILINGNPEPFTSKINLEIHYDSLQNFKTPINFKIIYIGSIESSHHDQILISLEKKNIKIGEDKLYLTLDPPKKHLIPSLEDLLGMSALMVSCSFKNNEFFRCSYYVRNDYMDNESEINENNFDIHKVCRCFYTEKPKIIINDVDWEECSDYEKFLDCSKENDSDINYIQKKTEDILNDFDDPFGFQENSFFKES